MAQELVEVQVDFEGRPRKEFRMALGMSSTLSNVQEKMPHCQLEHSTSALWVHVWLSAAAAIVNAEL